MCSRNEPKKLLSRILGCAKKELEKVPSKLCQEET